MERSVTDQLLARHHAAELHNETKASAAHPSGTHRQVHVTVHDAVVVVVDVVRAVRVAITVVIAVVAVVHIVDEQTQVDEETDHRADGRRRLDRGAGQQRVSHVWWWRRRHADIDHVVVVVVDDNATETKAAGKATIK